MAILELKWTSTAVKQRNHIFDYWNEQNKSTAYSKKLNIKIKKRISLLKQFPNLGKTIEFKNTRTISLGQYSIFYQLIENSIVITGLWDNRQDPKKLLKILKNE